MAGFCIINDVSERSYQLERGGQWSKGKGCDTFAPIGPWLVTRDEMRDPHALKMTLDVNGTRRQNGSTSTMIFRVPFLVSYVSEFMTLEPGDLISTGTPPGVGLGQKPPVFLRDGDVMELGSRGPRPATATRGAVPAMRRGAADAVHWLSSARSAHSRAIVQNAHAQVVLDRPVSRFPDERQYGRAPSRRPCGSVKTRLHSERGRR